MATGHPISGHGFMRGSSDESLIEVISLALGRYVCIYIYVYIERYTYKHIYVYEYIGLNKCKYHLEVYYAVEDTITILLILHPTIGGNGGPRRSLVGHPLAGGPMIPCEGLAMDSPWLSALRTYFPDPWGEDLDPPFLSPSTPMV